MLPTLLTPTLAPVPLPRSPVTVRAGMLNDVAFMDALQKKHSKQVGWMPTKQFEGKIEAGHVLVAEADGERVGYCIGNDCYHKHEDVGVIYQMNVLAGRQRSFVGATLLRAQFENSAWGCRLYCLWCAQDIAANKFWEAMGFVPLAFRTGSEKKGPQGRGRTHIFWQKRIRQGDTTTPWWFPSQTSGGSIREDRIVLPIPPGTHWSDAKPLILPGMPMPGDTKPIEDKTLRPRRTKPAPPPAAAVKGRPMGGLRFSPPPSPAPSPDDQESAEPMRPKKVKQKNDPRLVTAARELRDRWLEQVNATPLLPSGKYDVCRAIEGVPHNGGTEAMRLVDMIDVPTLPAPIAA